jgi:hypothetical protein
MPIVGGFGHGPVMRAEDAEGAKIKGEEASKKLRESRA